MRDVRTTNSVTPPTRGHADDIIDAGFGDGDRAAHLRMCRLAQTVYACDEMSGFIINENMNDKGVARQVPGEQLTKGAEELGLKLEEYVVNVAEGLKFVPVELRL